MPKPSTITTWATDPGATADPGATRRATGFVAGKKLPAKWLNWILNQNGAWLTYLRDLHTEAEFLNKVYRWTNSHYWKIPGSSDFARFEEFGGMRYYDAGNSPTSFSKTREISLTASQGSFTYAPYGLYTQGNVLSYQHFDLVFREDVEIDTLSVRCTSTVATPIDVKLTFFVFDSLFNGTNAPVPLYTQDATTSGTNDVLATLTIAPTPWRVTSRRRYCLRVDVTPNPMSQQHILQHAYVTEWDPGLTVY